MDQSFNISNQKKVLKKIWRLKKNTNLWVERAFEN